MEAYGDTEFEQEIYFFKCMLLIHKDQVCSSCSAMKFRENAKCMFDSLLFSVFCYSWRFIWNHILTATWVYQPSKTVPRPLDLDHLSLPDRLYHQVPQVSHHLPTKRTCKFPYFLFAGYILKNLKCNWKKNSAWIICNFQVCLSRKQLQCEAGIYLIKFTMNKFQGPVSSSNFSYSVYGH